MAAQCRSVSTTAQDRTRDPARARWQYSCAVSYWINCISKDHVLSGVESHFTQAGHGKPDPLKPLRKGDLVAFYSAGTTYRKGELIQCFTAIGKVADDKPFHVEVSKEFRPWRRKMEYLRVADVPIRPLIADLDFIEDKDNWGMPMRRGLFEVSAEDFAKISTAMKL